MKAWCHAALLLGLFACRAVSAEVVVTTAPAPYTRNAAPTTIPAFRPAATRPTTDLKPTLLTLQHQNVSPLVVFADIAAQCGRGFNPTLGDYGTTVHWPLVSIQAAQEPFWSVALAFDEKVHTYPILGPDGLLRAKSYGGYTGQRLVSGPFLILATKVQNIARFEGRPADLAQDCGVTMYVYAEPHIRLETLTRNCVPEIAVDEHGKSLVPLGFKIAPPEPIANSIGGAYNNFIVRLAPPPDAGQKIARLKGALHVAVTADADVVPDPDLSQPFKRDLDQATVTVSPLNERGAVEITIRGKNLRPQDWAEFATLLKTMRVTFYDPQGKEMPGMQGGGSAAPGLWKHSWSPTPGSRANASGKPVRLTLTIPVEFQDIPIPFEFHDLPLP